MKINQNHLPYLLKEEFDLEQNLTFFCSLEKLSTSISGDIFPDVSAHIIDGAAVVNMRKPKVAKTFGEYVDMDLMPYFMSRLEHVSRLDIVWDQYFTDSLKEYTRKV